MSAFNVVDSSGWLEYLIDSPLAGLFDLDTALVLEAARHRLPLADSLFFATARRHAATLWTQDEHFKDLPEVRYFPK